MTIAFSAMLIATMGSVWTVDDDAPANFTTIAAAIAAAADGDVIIVESGQYQGFSLAKRLSILGRAGATRPQVSGSTSVTSPSGFTIAGLDLGDLTVSGVSGRARIDDGSVGVIQASPDSVSLDVGGCAEIEISRMTVRGAGGISGTSPPGDGGTALRVTGSRAVVVGCVLEGGNGGGPAPNHGFGADGGHGLLARFGSEVIVAGCPLVRGGAAGECYFGLAMCHEDGVAGDAVRCTTATVWIRGTPSHHLEGGSYFLDWGGDPGFVLNVTHATAVMSGVSAIMTCIGCIPQPPGVVVDSGQVVTPAAEEPFIAVTGNDGAGAIKSILIHGPVGASTLLFASLTSDLVAVPVLGSPLWIGLPSLVTLSLATQGHTNPVSIPITMPAAAGIEGLVLELQAVFPGVPDALAPSKLFASNPAFLIVRP